MAVQSTIQVESQTTTPVNAVTSTSWQGSLRISHATDPGAATAIADLEVYVAVHHYWLPSTDTSRGLRCEIFNSGQVYGTITGSIGTCSVSIVDHVDAINKPIIYPHGSNAKVKAILKFTWNGTGTFTGTGNGITDCNFSIRANNYRQTRFYDGSTSVEDSYSYNTNVAYTPNPKMWCKDASAGSALRYGTEPNFTTYKTAVITCENASEINEASPGTSYEGNATSRVNKGNGSNAQNTVLTFNDPSLGITVDTILRCEFLPMCESHGYLNDDTLECVAMNTKPDTSPTWTECAANRGASQDTIVVTGSTGYQYSQRGWLFQSATLDALIKTWLNAWSTAHKGLALKFQTENVTGNGTQEMATDNDTDANMRPMIVVAYTEVGPSDRRVMVIS